MSRWKYGILILAVAVFSGLFVWSYTGQLSLRNPRARNESSSDAKRGHFGKYMYEISDQQGDNKKIAQFEPSLPTDDVVVLTALRSLAIDGYGVTVDELVQPEVETLNETNYVTFKVEKTKLFYELFRNSRGEVGSVRLWAVSTK